MTSKSAFKNVGKKAIIDPNLKSHRSDPFVIKKVEEAKQTIQKLRKAGFNFF